MPRKACTIALTVLVLGGVAAPISGRSSAVRSQKSSPTIPPCPNME